MWVIGLVLLTYNNNIIILSHAHTHTHCTHAHTHTHTHVYTHTHRRFELALIAEYTSRYYNIIRKLAVRYCVVLL